MRFATKAFAAGMMLVAGIAFAETGATDPLVIAQKDLMKSFGGAAKTLGDFAGGKAAFDAAAAEAAKATLVAGSADIHVKFEKAGVDPASESKPEIWTNWDDFVKKANDLNAAATAARAGRPAGPRCGRLAEDGGRARCGG